MLVQPHDEPHRRLAQPPGQLVEDVHLAGGAVHLVGAALRHLLADVFMHRVDGVVAGGVQHGQGLGPLVGKLLFHHEGRRHFVALEEVAIDDEAVHLGPQGDGFHQCRQHQVEIGIGKVLLRLIAAGHILLHRGQVDALGDVCLVVAAVGIDNAGDEVQRIQFPQQPAVPAVAPPSFLCFHWFLLFFIRIFTSKSNISY